MTGSDGNTLRIDHNQNDDLPLVHRNGVERKWNEEIAVYQSRGADNKPQIAPVSQDWNGGKLRVEADGVVFQSSVSSGGKVEWKSEKK